MFIKKTKSKNKTYYSIVEGYWEDGKTKHRVLAKLGTQDNLKELEGLAFKLLKAINSPCLPEKMEGFEEIARLKWGAVEVYQTLWNWFELSDIIHACPKSKFLSYSNALRAIFLMLLDRLIIPSSKLKTYSTQNKYFNLPPVALQHLYRSLDLLADGKELIESSVFQKNVSLFNMSVTLVFYDCTTFYFESKRADKLRDFGYSKDCKFNEVQVVMGLLMDNEGRPIGFDLYPGDTFEGHTVKTALEKLKERFNIQKVIWVADRGLCSKDIIALLKEKGYEYIVGCRLKTASKSIQTQALDLSSYGVLPDTDIRYKIIAKHPPQKSKTQETPEQIICTWSEKRAKKDKADRERLLEKARDLIENPAKVTSKRGAKRYLKTDTKTTGLDEAKIKADEAWDGIYGIQTNVTELTTLKIHEAYHQLWKIEECFRVLKTNLETRPIYHWTPNRIKGHFVLCFLSFLLERTLELTLKENKVDYSVLKIRESLSTLELSVIQKGGDTYLLRSKPDTLAMDIFRTLKIPIPQSFEPFLVQPEKG